MKKKSIVYIIAVIILEILLPQFAHPLEESSERDKVHSDMCTGRFPENHNYMTAGIYSCNNRQGVRIYRVVYAAEDVGDGYFDLNGNFIVRCGMDIDIPETAAQCNEIAGAYLCDYEQNLQESLCGDVQSYIACGCGCCEMQPQEECLYRLKGDDLNKIIEEDKKMRENPICRAAGCSRGIKYTYCD